MSLFGGGRPRQRRNRHGSAVWRSPEQLQQRRQRRRIDTAEILACGAVAVICAALISLIWINTDRAIRAQSDDTRGRVEAAITAQAATLAIQAQHEMLMIDQSLDILQTAWNDNPATFNLAAWRQKMPALTAVADDLFIADNKHLIVQDIIPAAVGQGIGSAYATFANGSLEPIHRFGLHGRDNGMLVGELGSGGVVRQYLMYLVRPLGKPAGWIIGASYRSSALTAVFASAGLGRGGLAALIDTHGGGVQALAGTAALRPKLALGNTPMYAAMLARPDGGIWIGRTAIDGVERIVAFRRVPGRDLIVLVGVDRDRAMASADTWADGARSLAAMASLLVLAIGGTLLWELWHRRGTRRRRRALAQAQALLEAAQGDLAAMRMRAAAGTAQMRAMLDCASDAVAVIDGEQHLAAWNQNFAALSNLPESALREGLPLDDLLRHLALAGRFAAPEEDIEAEVSRRIALPRPESEVGELAEAGPDGTSLVLRAQAVPDGGLVLTLRAADGVAVPDAADEATTADPVEW
ncbi:MAG TPA: PAS-domain containing protein [Acetobacteraceae bacterium]|nr:PAS-domain containing protein [Acetobacteraceae bacterium]